MIFRRYSQMFGRSSRRMGAALRRMVTVAGFALATTAAFAEEPGPINPDRPGAGTGADTVGRGALQVETGIDHIRERHGGAPTTRRTSLTTTVRYGLTDSVELRLDGEPLVVLRGADDATRPGDLTIGAKIKMLDGDADRGWPVVSILPSVKLPTAREPVGSEKVDATVLGLATFALPADLSLDLNAGLAAIGQREPSGYLVQGLVVATLNWTISATVAVFGEVFYASKAERDGTKLVGTGGGVTYTLTRDVALDAAVLTTVAGRGPDYRLQAGLSLRFWP